MSGALLLLLSAGVHAQDSGEGSDDGGSGGVSSSDSESDDTGGGHDGGIWGDYSVSRPSPDLDEGDGGKDAALDAVQNQHALPLDAITAATRKLTNGQILDAQLKSVGGSLRYEMKVLESGDQLRRYSFDARSGRLVGVK
ncbi:MAG: hypothetical protein IKE42_23200 [Aquamicrobium sp.]|jgi:hypothetical protein|uniref:PepSY domain-containing protein n=1 Tax=Mesorhizobium TaxID=68287 RepID=UPI0010137E4F|nr:MULTISPECIES: hypothetical protein [Mesorhizobium]MBR2690772.1 hypothetical protein [Aquamicrobium sp.]QAZ43535.1 hypothetical protein C1M53_11770 [Mesorhizobium sp. Pch-S]